MDITGARWGVYTAEAILKLRALHADGDFDAYWPAICSASASATIPTATPWQPDAHSKETHPEAGGAAAGGLACGACRCARWVLEATDWNGPMVRSAACGSYTAILGTP